MPAVKHKKEDDGYFERFAKEVQELTDPRPFIKGAAWAFSHPKERLTSAEANSRMEFPLGKGKMSAAEHGAAVKAELLAKRAAKGPRKPGGGRKPTNKTNYPPKNNADLKEMLAKSIPPTVAKKHTIKDMLGRLSRRGGR